MVDSKATSARVETDAKSGPLRDLVDQMVERPAPELDRALDAAAQCFARHGLSHTSIPDIARQLGVSKATVYRRVGSVNEALRLVVARELHDLVDDLEQELASRVGGDAVVVMAATVTRHGMEHPLVKKLLTDELHVMGELLPGVPAMISVAASILSSHLADAMRSGAIRASDPAFLADLIVRLAAIAVLAPPPDLIDYFRAALLPHLEPM